MRIVCNYTESGICRIFLHNPSQRHLCCRSHRVCLVQNNELVLCDRGRAIGGGVHSEDLLCAGEGLDLFSYNIDTTVVGGIEFEHHLAHVL